MFLSSDENDVLTSTGVVCLVDHREESDVRRRGDETRMANLDAANTHTTDTALRTRAALKGS